uniref:Uncharacterized protein n=1 Tax=Oryza meridionalis TaxID=40149 RepID=A0A0E0DW15_9ORYZ
MACAAAAPPQTSPPATTATPPPPPPTPFFLCSHALLIKSGHFAPGDAFPCIRACLIRRPRTDSWQAEARKVFDEMCNAFLSACAKGGLVG